MRENEKMNMNYETLGYWVIGSPQWNFCLYQIC